MLRPNNISEWLQRTKRLAPVVVFMLLAHFVRPPGLGPYWLLKLFGIAYLCVVLYFWIKFLVWYLGTLFNRTKKSPFRSR